MPRPFCASVVAFPAAIAARSLLCSTRSIPLWRSLGSGGRPLSGFASVGLVSAPLALADGGSHCRWANAGGVGVARLAGSSVRAPAAGLGAGGGLASPSGRSSGLAGGAPGGASASRVRGGGGGAGGGSRGGGCQRPPVISTLHAVQLQRPSPGCSAACCDASRSCNRRSAGQPPLSKFSRFLLKASVRRVSRRMCSRCSVQPLNVAGRNQVHIGVSGNDFLLSGNELRLRCSGDVPQSIHARKS